MRATYRALNGLRFFAAGAIVSYHYLPTTAGFQSLPSYCQNLVLAGPMALGFFYILSGFVLTHAYCNRVPNTPASRHSFWFARAARLYPVYLLAFTLFAPMAYMKYVLHPAIGVNGPRTFVLAGTLSLFAMQAWTPLAQAWNGPSWSLSVEAFFYFLFPFVLPKLLQLRWKLLLPALTALWLGMVALSIAHLNNMISDQDWLAWYENNPLFWTPLFLMGIALHRLAHMWSNIPPIVATLLGMTSLASLVLICGLAPLNLRDILLSGGAAPLLAIIVLTFSHPRALVCRVLGTPLLFEAGAVSYISYILQAPLWHLFRAVTGMRKLAGSGDSSTEWQLGVYLVLLLALSFVVRKTIERPAQRLLLGYKSAQQKTGKVAGLSDSSVQAALTTSRNITMRHNF